MSICLTKQYPLFTAATHMRLVLWELVISRTLKSRFQEIRMERAQEAMK